LINPTPASGSGASGRRGVSPESFLRQARLGLAVTAFLVVLFSALALFMLRAASADAHSALQHAQDVVAFGRFQSAVERKLIAVRGYLLDSDDGALHAIVAARTDAINELARVEGRAAPGELGELKRIRAAEEAHQKATAAAVALRRANATPEEVRKAFEATLLQRDALLESSARFLEQRERRLREAETSSGLRGRLSFGSLLVVAAVALGFAVVFLVNLTRRFFSVYEGERTERVRAESSAAALTESEARFRSLYESGMIGVCFPGLEGVILDANDAFLDMVGHTREELHAGQVRWADLTAPGSHEADERALEEIHTRGFAVPYEKEYVRPGGERISVLVGGSLLPGAPPRAVTFAVDVTARKRAEAERGELLLREREARAVAEAAQRRSAFLARASELLASSLDYRSTMQAVARLAVSDIADWCLIDVIPDGQFHRVAVGYAEPSRAELARQLEQQGLLDPQARIGPPQVLRTGESELLPWVTDEILRSIARTPHAHDTLRSMNIVSVMTVAIRNAQGIVGIVTFISAESGRRFGSEDLKLAEDLAVRAGVAMENARLFELVRQERATAEWQERRSAFLARASEILASSLDFRSTLSGVARLAVPEVADWCVVDLLEPDGTLRSIAVEHADSSRAELARRLARTYPYNARAPFGSPNVLRTGNPELATQVTEGMLRAVARDEDHYQILAGLGLRSYMCVPLQVRNRTLGTITLFAAESGRRYEPDDLALGEALAYRASLAIDNARLYGEAQEAIRVRDDFLSIASHELKTPITTLQLQLQSLLRRVPAGIPTESILARLKGADHQVERLTQLINDLLDISRITGGRLDLHVDDVDFSDVLRDVAARLEEPLARSGCSLKVSGLEPQRGRWDRFRLEQIVTNLLSNAMKYGAGRPIEIDLSGTGESVRFEIRDQGIGIAPDKQSRIFDRFERAVSGRHYGGLGLGLWIVRQIVDALGGTIAVRSSPGEGSAFTVELPRVGAETIERPAAAPPMGDDELPESGVDARLA
jgi:PAS domain S-box-containing protein